MNQRPWSRSRLLVEVVVIVGSILLAFAIDAWWEGKQRAAEAEGVIAALQAEFSSARSHLDDFERYNRDILARTDSITELLESSSGPTDVPLRFLITLTNTPTFDPPMAELQSLVQSGKLDLIDDPSLRRALAAWPSAVADLDEKSQIHLTFVYEDFLPTLRGMVHLAPIVEFRFAEIPVDSFLSIPANSGFDGLVHNLRLLPLRTINSPGALRPVSELLGPSDTPRHDTGPRASAHGTTESLHTSDTQTTHNDKGADTPPRRRCQP